MERKNKPARNVNLKCKPKNKAKMFSYLPLRTYVLPLLIIGSIFSLKGQEKEHKTPEEQPIKRYKGWKLEFGAPLTRFSIYEGGGLALGIAYLAPQRYIHNNISMGPQFELDFGAGLIDLTFMATGDYYFGNGVNRPSLGLGVGISSHVPFSILSETDAVSSTNLVVSPRFKYHLDWFLLHLGYDINIDDEIPNVVRLGMAFTLFGRKKEEKHPKTPEEEKQEALKRYKGFKLELAIPFTRFAIYGREGSGFGLVYFAPQYYINNNISVGLQLANHIDFSNILMATGDYYFGNGKISPCLGFGCGSDFLYTHRLYTHRNAHRLGHFSAL